MTILKTIANVDNLRQLRQRKAALKSKIETERSELNAIWQQMRTEYEPARLATNVARNFLGIGGDAGGVAKISGPLQLAADLFVRDPRFRFLLKYVAPFLISYWPRIAKKAKDITPEKAQVYGALRSGVASLRAQLRRKKDKAGAEEEAPAEA